MPLVDPRLFEFLLSVKDSYDLILPVHGNNYVEPLCALYSREVLPALEKKIFADQYGLKQFALGVNARPVEISTSLDFYSDTLFTNVNTSDDFDLLNKS
jgi:molybdopterin-guanine dinucleotide biosynthesis protein A